MRKLFLLLIVNFSFSQTLTLNNDFIYERIRTNQLIDSFSQNYYSFNLRPFNSKFLKLNENLNISANLISKKNFKVDIFPIEYGIQHTSIQ